LGKDIYSENIWKKKQQTKRNKQDSQKRPRLSMPEGEQ